MLRPFLKMSFLIAAVIVNVSFTGQALAVTQSMTANIAFDTPLSLTKTSDINFGTVKIGTADTYTITTAGTVTASGAGEQLYGTPTAGSITVSGSATQSINISAGDYVPNGGVALQNATCSYNGGAPGSCAISNAETPGSGKTLLVGVQAIVDGTQVAGATAAPSFTVTIAYQ